MKEHQIVLLQETWLFNFEKNLYSDICPGTSSHSKQVDDKQPIPPIQKPRGHGGIAILWKDSLDDLIKPIDAGSSRIAAVTVKTNGTPLMIICAYMPCKGNSNSLTEYAATLDEIFEIIQRYGDEYHVIIGGDLNAELFNEKPDKQDYKLQQFCAEMEIREPENCEKGPTFTNSLGVQTKQLDYILGVGVAATLIIRTQIMHSLVNNVSDHYPIGANTTIMLQHPNTQVAKKPDNPQPQLFQKIKWDKIDLTKYHTMLDDKLRDEICTINTQADLEGKIEEFHELLRSSALAAQPAKRTVKQKRKTGNPIWNAQIAAASAAKKLAHHRWKKAGRPNHENDPTVVERKKARAKFRQELRHEVARRRESRLQEIMDTEANDRTTFYKLVKEQRQTKSSGPAELLVQGQVYKEDKEMCDGWKLHFEQLATPSAKKIFDDAYKKSCDLDILTLKDLASMEKDVISNFSYAKVQKSISSLNTNKAPDPHGLTAEHLKYATPLTIGRLQLLLNKILETRKVPVAMKVGVLTPVYKNKKDKKDPYSYRGITVTAVTGKVLEVLLRDLITPILRTTQSPLQAGFTKGSSPLNAAFVIQEALGDAKAKKDPLYIALLDAKTAFDVVALSSLNRKLYHDGITGQIWQIINSLQEEASTQIKWKGYLSEQFAINQGVRQGGILSTELYKRYINSLLIKLDEARLGVCLGDIHCPAPTCADDVALMSTSPLNLQLQISIAADYSKRERYELQPSKSMILPIGTNVPIDVWEEQQTWEIDGQGLAVVTKATHLGIELDNTTAGVSSTIEANIVKARRALYSLTGIGFHGRNGLNPRTVLTLYKTYIFPILTYGLEVLLPSKTAMKEIENFHRKSILQLCSLDDKVAGPAPFLLTGILPAEASIHKKALGLLVSMVSKTTSLERSIIDRQAIIRQDTSWTTRVAALLRMYKLPELQELLLDVPRKKPWANKTGAAIAKFQWMQITSSASDYSSLKYIQSTNCQVDTLHPALSTIKNNSRDTYGGMVKTWLLTGTYALQANRWQNTANQVDGRCRLCEGEAETREHFLAICPALSETRRRYLDLCPIDLPRCTKKLTAIILDAPDDLVQDSEYEDIPREELEHWSRRICCALHRERTCLLAKLSSERGVT
jgi:hypothetical protein